MEISATHLGFILLRHSVEEGRSADLVALKSLDALSACALTKSVHCGFAVSHTYLSLTM